MKVKKFLILYFPDHGYIQSHAHTYTLVLIFGNQFYRLLYEVVVDYIIKQIHLVLMN